MGRLINTDDLIGCAIIKPTTSEEFGHILACENKIVHDDIPTAFDVEAVVKTLKKESVKVYGEITVIGLNKAIEIVRNGGVKNA